MVPLAASCYSSQLPLNHIFRYSLVFLRTTTRVFLHQQIDYRYGALNITPSLNLSYGHFHRFWPHDS
jgi:hypothetical protein